MKHSLSILKSLGITAGLNILLLGLILLLLHESAGNEDRGDLDQTVLLLGLLLFLG